MRVGGSGGAGFVTVLCTRSIVLKNRPESDF